MPELNLFNYLYEKESESSSRETRLYLKAQWIQFYMRRIDPTATAVHPFYTLHNHEHFDAVVKNLYIIAETAGLLESHSIRSLTYEETFFLIAAAYFHDIGMILVTDEDEDTSLETSKPIGEIIREDHHERSARFVWKEGDQFLLDNTEKDIIALLCKGHRLDSLAISDFDDRHIAGSVIRMRLLGGMIQVADELDMSHRRAPSYQRLLLEGLPQFSPTSRYHWMKHYYTEDFSVRREYQGNQEFATLRIDVKLMVPDEHHYHHVEQLIRKRIIRHLESLKFDRYGFEIRFGEITPRYQVDLERTIIPINQVQVLYVGSEINDARTSLAKLGLTSITVCENEAQAFIASTQNQSKPFDVVVMPVDLGGVMNIIAALKSVMPGAQFILADKGGYNLPAEARRRGIPILRVSTHPNEFAERLKNIIEYSYTLDNTTPKEPAMNSKEYMPAPYRILIVDDDKDYAEKLKTQVEKTITNVQITMADGADTAVPLLASHEFHIAFLDRMMNNRQGKFDDMAGIELGAHMHDEYPSITRIMMTRDASFQHYTRAMETGMFAFKDKDETTTKELALIAQQQIERRRVTLMSSTGMVVMADRMIFYGKRGTVVKTITDQYLDNAGIVEVEGEKWRATTAETKEPNKRISQGIEILVLGIYQSALQVVPPQTDV
jgi:CheY-like chemotaxis protein